MELQGNGRDRTPGADNLAAGKGSQDVTLRSRPSLWAGLLGWCGSPQAVAADDEAGPAPDAPTPPAADGAGEAAAPDEERGPSFAALPEHLLQKVFSYLEGSSRRHHFNV